MNIDMSTLLKNAGFEVSDNFREYEKFSEFRLPFGSLTSMSDRHVSSEFGRSLIDSANYFRRNATRISEEELQDECPKVFDDSLFRDFLIENIDKVRVMKQDEYHRVSLGYIGQHTKETDFVNKTEYGFSDFVFYFTYYYEERKLQLDFSMSSFNNLYQSHLEEKAKNAGGELKSDVDKLNALKALMDDCEFIPLKIEKQVFINLSHRGYYNDGYWVREQTCPCLGLNIKEDKQLMNKLSDWIKQGGRIVDTEKYLIHKNFKSGTYYLARYRKKENEE